MLIQVIPYHKMSLSLLTITSPVIIGMIFYKRYPKFGPHITRIGSIAGFGIIFICHALEIIIFPDMFVGVPLTLYLLEFLLPLTALIVTTIASSVFCLEWQLRRTIAIESSIQNVGTALTVITLSFEFEVLRKVWLFPLLYSFAGWMSGIVVATVYQFYKRCMAKDDNKQNTIANKVYKKVKGDAIKISVKEELL